MSYLREEEFETNELLYGKTPKFRGDCLYTH